ncbi:unnamed protein product, partial [marine sediment metagenome]
KKIITVNLFSLGFSEEVIEIPSHDTPHQVLFNFYYHKII